MIGGGRLFAICVEAAVRTVSTSRVRLLGCVAGALVCLAAAPVCLAAAPVCLAAAPDAKQAVDEQVSVYKKAGDPTEPGDFANKSVAEKDNAAPLLRAAFKSIDTESPAWKTFRENDDAKLPWTDAQSSAIRAAVDANPTVFEQVDQAMQRPGVDWQVKWTSPTLEILLPQLSEMRQIGRLVAARALLNHQSGDDAAAIADVRRVIFISRAADKITMVIGHLVALSIMSTANDVVIQIAPDLRIGVGKGHVSAPAVRSLIDTLLDAAPLRDAQRLSLLCERMYQVDCVRCLLDGTLDISKFAGPQGKPAAPNPAAHDPQKAWADALVLIRYTTAIAEAAKASADLQTLKQKLPRIPPEAVGGDRSQHPIFPLIFPAPLGPLKVDYRVEAEAAMAAVALAVRSYVVDHPGERPKTLDDLVPQYLRAVPRDPMAVDQPLQYNPSPKHFIVYSVGEDGTNEGGTETDRTKKGVTPAGRWQAFDAVVHLDPAPSAAKP
jgi:hypothetical protein